VQYEDHDETQHNRRGRIYAVNEEHHHQSSDEADERRVPREVLERRPATHRRENVQSSLHFL
jgi:hypothetical protein